jgi:hypothetical protein
MIIPHLAENTWKLLHNNHHFAIATLCETYVKMLNFKCNITHRNVNHILFFSCTQTWEIKFNLEQETGLISIQYVLVPIIEQTEQK